ncbi:MAG: Na+/H+ antiporter NhaA [Bdellovibrionales bacterium]|nr:Na+/H+ antiporter NhaA [Bdellovibrionales bacterium]
MESLKEFFRLESASGLMLFVAMFLALIAENTPLSSLYTAFLDTPVEIRVGALELSKSLLHWIDEGLMAVFFFLIGLEVKREFYDGELSSLPQIVLPGVAALGGMLVPGLVYYLINREDPNALHGWAIPTATDVAFALGVLSLLRDRVPLSLKVFLMALAIFDDLGAMIIIAIFYTDNLSYVSMGLASLGLGVLFILNRRHVCAITPYVLLGLFLWTCTVKSGVHATLAGAALALFIPFTGKDNLPSPLKTLEHALHPWVAFGVLPLFAFANAGISLSGVGLDVFSHPVKLGVTSGLVLGKVIGVFGFTAFAVLLGIAKLPEGANWRSLLGVSCLTGIGFTMSLFISALAFNSADLILASRIGVVIGSAIAGILGYLILRTSPRIPGLE